MPKEEKIRYWLSEYHSIIQGCVEEDTLILSGELQDLHKEVEDYLGEENDT